MLRKIMNFLMTPGRKLGLDQPEARRARLKNGRLSPITIPSRMSPLFIGIFLTFAIAEMALQAWLTWQGWEEGTSKTANYGAGFYDAVTGKFALKTAGIVVIAIVATYVAAGTGGLIMGAYQVGYNLMDRLLGQRRMVERATEEGRIEGDAQGYDRGKAEGLTEGKAEGLTEGKAEGLAQGMALERERSMRRQRRRRRRTPGA